jgi:hypothetical protein
MHSLTSSTLASAHISVGIAVQFAVVVAAWGAAGGHSVAGAVGKAAFFESHGAEGVAVALDIGRGDEMEGEEGDEEVADCMHCRCCLDLRFNVWDENEVRSDEEYMQRATMILLYRVGGPQAMGFVLVI